MSHLVAAVTHSGMTQIASVRYESLCLRELESKVSSHIRRSHDDETETYIVR